MIPKAEILASLWGTGPELSGDFKQFFYRRFWEHILLPEYAHGQAFADGRAKLNWGWSDWLSLEAHHVVTLSTVRAKSRLELGIGKYRSTRRKQWVWFGQWCRAECSRSHQTGVGFKRRGQSHRIGKNR